MEVRSAPLACPSSNSRYTRQMAQHDHAWEASYEFRGTTYRECSDSGCRGHQQWVCALDRWSDDLETPSPRERQEQREAERKGGLDELTR